MSRKEIENEIAKLNVWQDKWIRSDFNLLLKHLGLEIVVVSGTGHRKILVKKCKD